MHAAQSMGGSGGGRIRTYIAPLGKARKVLVQKCVQNLYTLLVMELRHQLSFYGLYIDKTLVVLRESCSHFD
jgi:hypothetical protein